MIRGIKKLPFPDKLLVNDFTLFLNSSDLSEDGEPISKIEIKGKCIFSEHSKRIIYSNGKETILVGKCIMKGDIAPSLNLIGGGTITINNRNYEVHSYSRPRNPDGTIYSTNLELK